MYINALRLLDCVQSTVGRSCCQVGPSCLTHAAAVPLAAACLAVARMRPIGLPPTRMRHFLRALQTSSDPLQAKRKPSGTQNPRLPFQGFPPIMEARVLQLMLPARR